MSAPGSKLRIAAVADLHCKKDPAPLVRPLLEQIADRADVLAICGDLTDYGLPEEARLLARELATFKKPILAILGNHDYESGQQDEVSQILSDAGIVMLDGQAHEVEGVGFAGAKGFAGGFGTRTLEPWGEPAIKRFVQEALDEALRLELALSRLRTPQRVALLHYSPIQATVEGEPLEIYPFLGSSRLEDPLNRYEVAVVFHGHAHRGSPEGKTRSGIPVFNVSLPLLRRLSPDMPPFRLHEIEIAAPTAMLQESA